MPQIRICPTCNKALQTGEIHRCLNTVSEYIICEKCGEKYPKFRSHVCPTRI